MVAAVATAAACLVPLCAPSAASAAPAAALAPHVPGRIIVSFKPSANTADRIGSFRRHGTSQHRSLGTRDVHTEVITLPAGTTVEQAIAAYRADPTVRSAEPDYILTRAAVADDTFYRIGYMWGMEGDASVPSNPFGSGAAEAWAAGYTGSSNVVVGVIDEGIDIAHPDLAANIWVNPGETAANGIDDDDNGFIDDVNGWDFLNADNTVYDGVVSGVLDPDVDAHGTHVAGTIGASGGNNRGVAGVNWSVKMISAKFLDSTTGGSTTDAISAINYLVDLKVNRGVNLVAINNSWGGTSFSQSMLDAINSAGDADILFVAAAGNSNINHDVTADFPSNYQCTNGGSRSWDCVVSVAATDMTGNRAGFSDYGATTIDIGAPGDVIVSTIPDSAYGAASGTSMAAPHVTGAVALCSSINPTLTAADIRAAIMSTTAAETSLAGKTVTGGRLDIGAMFSACLPPGSVAPPGMPAAPTTAAGDRAMTVSWTSPVTNGGAITDYVVKMATTKTGTYTAVAAGTCATHPLTTTSCTATGLTPGVRYWFKVTAANSAGSGPTSPVSMNRKAVASPSAPATIASLGSKRIIGNRTFTWTLAANNGTRIIRYEYRWKAHSSATFSAWTATALSRRVTLGALTKGVAYDIEVRGVNAVGNGVTKAATITH